MKIKLENNLIENIDNLKCLVGHKIQKLYLKGNPITTKENYKNILFNMIPSLESIDGTDKDGNLVESTIYGDIDEEDEEEDEEEENNNNEQQSQDEENNNGDDEGNEDEENEGDSV